MWLPEDIVGGRVFVDHLLSDRCVIAGCTAVAGDEVDRSAHAVRGVSFYLLDRSV